MVLGVLIWEIYTLEWAKGETCTLKLRKTYCEFEKSSNLPQFEGILLLALGD